MSAFLLQLRWTGRFGNRLFQYAYGATYARITGLDYWLPSAWEGTRLFRSQPHRVIEDDDIRRALADPDEGAGADQRRIAAVRARHPDAELFDAELVADPFFTPGHPICHANGCAYNYGIFPRVSRRHLQALCEFSEEVQRTEAYKRFSDLQGLYDVAHLRRDDIANIAYNQSNIQGYSVISKDAYRRAFRQYGFDEREMVWVSDDFTGQWHPDRGRRAYGGWHYPIGSDYTPGLVFDWLSDFLKLYFARTIFRANSSFSWWAATLSPTARVFSPIIDKQHVYGVHGLTEIDVDFVEGNHPHYLYGGDYPKPEIHLGP